MLPTDGAGLFPGRTALLRRVCGYRHTYASKAARRSGRELDDWLAEPEHQAWLRERGCEPARLVDIRYRVSYGFIGTANGQPVRALTRATHAVAATPALLGTFELRFPDERFPGAHDQTEDWAPYLVGNQPMLTLPAMDDAAEQNGWNASMQAALAAVERATLDSDGTGAPECPT